MQSTERFLYWSTSLSDHAAVTSTEKVKTLDRPFEMLDHRTCTRTEVGQTIADQISEVYSGDSATHLLLFADNILHPFLGVQ